MYCAQKITLLKNIHPPPRPRATLLPLLIANFQMKKRTHAG